MTASLELPPLPPSPPDWPSFQVWWQQVATAIIRNAETQASLADDLDTAIGGAGGIADQVAILGSFTIPTMILTASDVGTTVTIAIAAHARHYADGTEVPVAAGSVTGLAFSTKYGVYYDDEPRSGGAPTFLATTDLETAQYNYVAGRHYLGTVTSPADGAAATTGGAPPAGSGYTAGSSGQVIT